MSNLTPRADKLERAVHGNEIESTLVDVPHTTIVNEQGNPRQIADLTNNLKVSMGVERIAFTDVSRLDNEFGPAGETCFETNSRDARIRMYGTPQNVSNINGTRVRMNVGSTLEVTFFGTGLNILEGWVGGPDLRVTIDDGAESADAYTVVPTTLINDRYVNVNSPINFNNTKSLTLGWHTIKYRVDSAGSPWDIAGVEVLNETSQLTINPGQPRYDSETREVVSQQLIDYNTGFDGSSDTLGVKGGRVLIYQAIDGSINKRLTATDPAITGNPGAPEEVTNGDFATDVSGWTNISDSSGTITFDAGKMRMTNGSSGAARAEQNLTGLTIGKTYNVSVTATSSFPANNGFGFGFESITGLNPNQWFNINTGTFNLSFVAGSTTENLVIYFAHTVSVYGTVDDISVKEVGYNHLALGDTDHSNEEIIRSIHFEEFGKILNGTQDFSNLTAAVTDRAFTLDDGTTTLIGNNIQAGTTHLNPAGSVGDFITLTFVGTGLDYRSTANIGALGYTTDVIINGVTVGELTTQENTTKICSGLPYGTHTVKFNITGGSGAIMSLTEFVLYGPKKPTLDSTDIELAEYNIMADFVDLTDNQSASSISTGVIRKNTIREWSYEGSWSGGGGLIFNPANYHGGFSPTTPTNGASAEITFWGTGIVYTHVSLADEDPATQLSIDGSTNFSSYTNTLISGDLVGTSFTAATGVLDAAKSSGTDWYQVLSISGLPLGLHTFKVVKGGGTWLRPMMFDIITPIHINDTKAGSLSLKDLRKDSDLNDENKNKVDLSRAKAWCLYNPSTGYILESYNISGAWKLNGEQSVFWFKKPFKNNPVVLCSSDGTTSAAYLAISGPEAGKEITERHGFRIVNTTTPQHWYIVCFGELENEEDIDLGDL